ncbi:MAG: hypothetical protein HY927_10555 [Elusimicrobia bacterium]|nr:hypothetical protein [Elusimicrobiota bacterium]
MKCPNCGDEHAPEIVECPKCGIVLTKWSSGTMTPGALLKADKETRSHPIILYGGLAVAVFAFWYSYRHPAAAPQGSEPGPGASAPAAPGDGGEDIPNPWRFQGVVLDVRDGTPVAAVKVSFSGGGKAYQAVTDGEGRYGRAVPALESGGYSAVLAHPDFKPQHLRGSLEGMSDEYRARVDCSKDAEKEILTGKAGEPMAVDFLLCRRRR